MEKEHKLISSQLESGHKSWSVLKKYLQF